MTEFRRKVFGVELQKVNAEAEKDGTCLVRGYFTSDNKDEVGDIITRSATEKAIGSYRKWGNIRYMHQPRPVAKVTRIGTDDGLEWNEVEIRVIAPDAVFEVQNGLLSALSVGINVNYEDVQLLQDGGWIINGYQLAEISLVDHPANYDAFLKDITQTDELRQVARESGVFALARALDHTSKKDLTMTDKTNAPVATEAVIAEVVDEKALNLTVPAEEVEAPVADAPVAEAVVETPVAEADKSADVAEVVAEIAPDVTDAVVPEAEKGCDGDKPADEDEEDEEDDKAVEPAYVSEFRSAISEMTKFLKELAPKPIVEDVKDESIPETSKTIEATDVVAPDETEAKFKALNDEIAALKKQLEAPAERKGLVEETHIEDLKQTEESKDKSLTSPLPLKKALAAHFNANK